MLQNHTHVAGVFEQRVTEDPATVWGEIDAELGITNNRTVVNEATAQKYAAVFQAVQVYAGDVGQIPAIAYERKGKGKARAAAHPAHKLMHRAPNPDSGPFQFKFLMQARCLLWGNAYAWIERKEGLPVALWPIASENVTPFRANGERWYDVTDASGRRETYAKEHIFHLQGPGTNDLAGTSVVGLAAAQIGAGLQADTYTTKFLENNATPPLTLEFPDAIDAESAKNILKNWSSRHAGANNAGRPGFLDRGGKVNTYAMSHVDSQFLEQKKWNKTEVASWFNLPPHKLGDLENATFSNIEQQSIDYVVFSLMPWLVRWQDEANRKLFEPSEIESDKYFVEFKTAALVRGDLAARMEAYGVGIDKGIFSFNEVRAMENLNPVEGGDNRLVPMNMVLVDEAGEVTPIAQPAPAPAAAPEPPDTSRAVEQLLRHEVTKLCGRLQADAAKAASKPASFLKWIDEGISKKHREVFDASLQVAARATGAAPGLSEALLEEFRLTMLSASDGDPATFADRVAYAAAAFTETAGPRAVDHLTGKELWNLDTRTAK